MNTTHPQSGRSPEERLRLWVGDLLAGAEAAHPAAPVAGLTRDFLRSQGVEPYLVEKARTDRALKRALPAGPSREHFVAAEMARRAEFVYVVNALQMHCPSHPPVILKGQALAYLLYPQPWLRPRSDVDALVPRDRFSTITGVFRELGYEPANAVDGDLVLRQLSLRKQLYGIDHIWDVHWSISNRTGFQKFLSYEQLLETGSRLAVDGVTFVVPDMVRNLLIACLHLIGHHTHDLRLIWLYDIHLMAGRLSQSQRQQFIDLARGRPEIGSACHAALRLACEHLPGDAAARLQEALHPGPGHRSRTKQSYFTRLLDDARALNAPDRLRFIAQHLFPSAGYMTRKFGIRHRWQLPLWYARRILRALPKLFHRR